MSSPQLTQAIRANRPNMHELLMLGLITEKNFQGVLGGSFIRNPFSPSGLIDTIKAILRPDSGSPKPRSPPITPSSVRAIHDEEQPDLPTDTALWHRYNT